MKILVRERVFFKSQFLLVVNTNFLRFYLISNLLIFIHYQLPTMKTQKQIIKIFDKILLKDISNALKSEVTHARLIAKNMNTPTDFEVFLMQYSRLVDICEYYNKTL